MNLHKELKSLNSLKKYISKLRNDFKIIEEEKKNKKKVICQKKNALTHKNSLMRKKKKREIILTEKYLFVSQTYIVICNNACMMIFQQNVKLFRNSLYA